MTQLVPVEHIERLIHLVRGEKVLLDTDLAMLYAVATGNLNKAGKRNQQRFPPDFMSEQGVAMLSSVLRSERAVQVNVAIMLSPLLDRAYELCKGSEVRTVCEMEQVSLRGRTPPFPAQSLVAAGFPGGGAVPQGRGPAGV